MWERKHMTPFPKSRLKPKAAAPRFSFGESGRAELYTDGSGPKHRTHRFSEHSHFAR